MSKIDFLKVEQNLGEAIHKTFIKKLSKGKPSVYPRAYGFLGFNVRKPSPPDTIDDAIGEWREELKESGAELATEKVEQAIPPGTDLHALLTPPEEKDLTAVPDPIPPEDPIHLNPIYILRKHLLWFVRKRVANIYKLLGTTKEEIISFRKKREFTPEEAKRIEEILAKSKEINAKLMKKLGLDTDDSLVEKEKKKHMLRRFNVRDSWLPL